MAKIDVVAVRTAVKKGELKIVAEKGFFFMEDTKSGERVKLNESYVLCKDCKHRAGNTCYRNDGGMWIGCKLTDNDFCSYGERKDNV